MKLSKEHAETIVYLCEITHSEGQLTDSAIELLQLVWKTYPETEQTWLRKSLKQ